MRRLQRPLRADGRWQGEQVLHPGTAFKWTKNRQLWRGLNLCQKKVRATACSNAGSNMLRTSLVLPAYPPLARARPIGMALWPNVPITDGL